MHISETSKHPSSDSSVVVVLEDDRTTSDLLCLILKKDGLIPLPCYSVAEANEVLHGETRISGMLIDLFLPDGDGIEALRNGRRIYNNLPCFVLTAKETVESAVTAMKAGAENYLIKPFEPVSLMSALKGAISLYRGLSGDPPTDTFSPQGVRKWKSPRMQQAMEIVKIAAKTMSPVVITGGECTGKGRLAQLIHKGGRLSQKGYTTINLKTVSPSQIEAELFGAPLDSLGDSQIRARGKLEKCRGQTLYIENIHCLHPAAQDRLLSWLSEEPATGAGKQSACRMICSTSADILAAVKEGSFRKDLWYALAIYHIEVPALAERLEDLPLLCENIITRICVTRKLRRPTLTRKALDLLMDHNWPGNLSELYNNLEHAVSRTDDGLIGPDDFPVMSRQPLGGAHHAAFHLGASSIEEINKLTLQAALEACGGNRRRAAQRLKISLRTIYNMIERYELPKRSNKRRASTQPLSVPADSATIE
jgi:DNA-binding NtrC family response regulator